MKIILRFDGSQQIGLGHFSRMMCLKDGLREKAKNHIEMIFAFSSDPFLNQHFHQSSIKVLINDNKTDEEFIDSILMKEDPDLIVFDQKYEYKKKDLIRWKKRAKLVSIDFIGKDYHIMNLVIIPNGHFDERSQPRLQNLLSGINYTIINRKIVDLNAKPRTSEITNIVVTTGGADPEGVLLTLIEWLKDIKLEYSFTFLFGENFKYMANLPRERDLPEYFLIKKFNYGDLLAADIAIATFGISVYEFMSLNIPVLVISHSIDNSASAEILANRYSSVFHLGYIKKLNARNFYVGLRKGIKLVINQTFGGEEIKYGYLNTAAAILEIL